MPAESGSQHISKDDIVLKADDPRSSAKYRKIEYKQVFFDLPKEPAKPCYPLVGKPKERADPLCGALHHSGGLLGFFCVLPIGAGMFFLLLLAGFVTGWILPVVAEKNEAADLKEKADRGYQHSMERYEQDLSEYRQKQKYREQCVAEEKKARQTAQEVIRGVIEENKATRQRLNETRKALCQGDHL